MIFGVQKSSYFKWLFVFLPYSILLSVVYLYAYSLAYDFPIFLGNNIYNFYINLGNSLIFPVNFLFSIAYIPIHLISLLLGNFLNITSLTGMIVSALLAYLVIILIVSLFLALLSSKGSMYKGAIIGYLIAAFPAVLIRDYGVYLSCHGNTAKNLCDLKSVWTIPVVFIIYGVFILLGIYLAKRKSSNS